MRYFIDVLKNNGQKHGGADVVQHWTAGEKSDAINIFDKCIKQIRERLTDADAVQLYYGIDYYFSCDLLEAWTRFRR